MRLRLVFMIAAFAFFARTSAQQAPNQAGRSAVQAPPQATNATPPVTLDPELAKLVAAAAKYDIVGIKLGSPLRDAVLALRRYSPMPQLRPDSAKYDVLPYALTYGIAAAYPSEVFYLSTTMDPSPVLISAVGRYINFTKENAPTQQVLVQDLKTKYGEPSWDSGSAFFNDMGYRIMGFVDDGQGMRLKNVDLASGQLPCSSNRFFWDRSTLDRTANPEGIDNRISTGLDETYRFHPRDCWDFTMIQVEMFSTKSQPIFNKPGYSTFPWGNLQLPDVVGSMSIKIASGPLDRKATEATRKHLVDAIAARDLKAKEDAARNRPKL